MIEHKYDALSNTASIGFKTFNLGRWKYIHADCPQLKCPSCECCVTVDYYLLAVGTRAMSYCPYCGVSLLPDQMDLFEEGEA